MSNADTIEQLEQMRAGIEQRYPISIRQFRMMVRPLTIMEIQNITMEVAEKLETLPDHARTTMMESSLLAKEKLKAASTSEPGGSDAKITDYILDRMTADELQSLFKQYVAVCDRCNPSLEQLSDDRLKELSEAVKKNGDLALIELSSLELINLCRFLLAVKGD